MTDDKRYQDEYSDLEHATRLDGTTMPAPRVLPNQHCWCGGEVGARTPGDHLGLGCLVDITHNWTRDSDDRSATEITHNGRVLENGETLGFVAQQHGEWVAFKVIDEINWGLSFWSDEHPDRDAALKALQEAPHD